MKKSKIAISLEKPLLDLIDSKVDGSIIRSRSQAIEYFLNKGLSEYSVTNAVILLKGDHQKYSLQEIKGTSLIQRQLSMLSKAGIKKVFIVTQRTKEISKLLNAVADSPVEVEVIEKEVKGNTQALNAVRDKLEKSSFVVMSGDILNDFDLSRMIKKHLESDKLATMGLMTREKTSEYGAAVMSGDLIIDFEEQPKTAQTHVVNAGIYIFKPEAFELMDAPSLERDVFPKLARINQLVGYFTHGEYIHLEEQEWTSLQ